MTLVKSIWEGHSSIKDTYIKSKIEFIMDFDVFIATNQITGKRLFIMNIQINTDALLLKNAKFRGLAIQILNYGTHQELTILLLDNSLEDIFISFIENILSDLQTCRNDNEALNRISEVILRWKKLFDKASFIGLSSEQQKGLFGELLIFNTLLIENLSPLEIINAWVGPMKGDKDYIFGSTAIEVKVTSSKYPCLKITNERQLENITLNKLYLILIIVEEVAKNGILLLDLIIEIRNQLKDNPQILDTFNERLELVGFLSDDGEFYNQRYYIKEINKYLIDENFPRITKDTLSIGVYNVSYNIELSACDDHRVVSATIEELIHGY